VGISEIILGACMVASSLPSSVLISTFVAYTFLSIAILWFIATVKKRAPLMRGSNDLRSQAIHGEHSLASSTCLYISCDDSNSHPTLFYSNGRKSCCGRTDRECTVLFDTLLSFLVPFSDTNFTLSTIPCAFQLLIIMYVTILLNAACLKTALVDATKILSQCSRE